MTGNRLDIYHHTESSADPNTVAVLQRLNLILTLIERQVMPNIADINLSIQAQSTVVTGVVALLQHLASELQTAINNESPDAIQGVVDLIKANTKSLSDAVAANTVAAPETATTAVPIPNPPISTVQPTPPVAEPGTVLPDGTVAGEGQTVLPDGTIVEGDPNAPPHGELPAA